MRKKLSTYNKFLILFFSFWVLYEIYLYFTPLTSSDIAEYYEEYIVEDIADFYNFPIDDIQSINFSLVETSSNEYKGIIDLDIDSQSTYLKDIILKVTLYYDGDNAVWEFSQ